MRLYPYVHSVNGIAPGVCLRLGEMRAPGARRGSIMGMRADAGESP